MPWTYDDPPGVALNWDEDEVRACVDAANAVLAEGGTDEDAIYACIAAAGKAGGKQMKQKIFRAPIELKANGEPGEFRSVFATFNVVDHDGDVTLPGAFREGQEAVVEGWNHDYGLPPGKGTIHADEEKAWVDGRFFLDTAVGKDHYTTLKNLEGLEQWSYTFTVEESETGEFEGQDVQYLKALDVWGVAPVTRGAGIGTRTVALKGAGFTEDEIRRIKALLKEQEGDGASEEDAGASDSGEGDEGQGGSGDGDVEPSGPAPRVVLTQIDIELLES